MTTPIHVVDIYHLDEPVDFHAMKDAGVVGVIIKATQGSTKIDPKFFAYHQRAISVFDAECVHCYHFLDDSDPVAQMRNFVTTTSGLGGRWLDFEPNPAGTTCTFQAAIRSCHELSGKQGHLPGMYGSDKGLLGVALDNNHFVGLPLWLARYGTAPGHACDLWQFAEGKPGDPTVAGKIYDVSTFRHGDAQACEAWLKAHY